MALIDKLTDLTSFDYNKVGETNTTDGRFEVNQKDNDGRVESLDDLPRPRVDSPFNKLAPAPSSDIEIVTSGIVRRVAGELANIERAGNFLTTPEGALFTIKQNVLQKTNASPHTRTYKNTSPIKALTSRSPSTTRHSDSAAAGGGIGSAISGQFKDGGPTYFDQVRRGLELPGVNQKDVNKVRQGITFKKTSGGFGSNSDLDSPTERQLKVNIYDDKRSYGLQSFLFDKNQTSEFPEDFIKFFVNDPVGKRLIQFPAYLTDISDNSSGEYNGTRYIGRADQVFVYSGYSRTISFGFRVAALTRGDIPVMWKKIDALKSLTLPKYEPIYQEQVEPRPIAPFVELTIGDLYVNQPGYFTSISTTIPQTSNWETEDGHQLTHICDITLEYTFIGKQLPNLLGKQFDIPGYDKELEVRALKKKVDETKKFSSDTLADIEYDFTKNSTIQNAVGEQRTQGFASPDFSTNLSAAGDVQIGLGSFEIEN